MKKIAALLPVLVFLFSCVKENNGPVVETITKGDKWGLTIGAPAADVYSRLQTLGIEKKFGQVGVYNQPSFYRPEALEHRLQFYSGISLQSSDPVIYRAIVTFYKDTINSIEAGGGLTDEIPKWPFDAADNIALKKGDLVNQIYDKLLAVYQMPAYSNYQLFLPDKPLNKPFDPAMASSNEWGFDFSVDVSSSISGRSSVQLFFKNGNLDRIQHTYSESKVYN